MNAESLNNNLLTFCNSDVQRLPDMNETASSQITSVFVNLLIFLMSLLITSLGIPMIEMRLFPHRFLIP